MLARERDRRAGGEVSNTDKQCRRMAWLATGWLLLVQTGLAMALPVIRTSGQEENPAKFDARNVARPGFCAELIRALARVDPALRFSGQHVMRPLRRIEAELSTGRMDVFFGLVDAPQRRKQFLGLDTTTLYTEGARFAVRADDPVQILGLEAIRRLGREGKIAVPQGSVYVDFLRRQGGLHVDDGTVSVEVGLWKLILGRVRFVFYGEPALKRYSRMPGFSSRIRLLPVEVGRFNVYAMASPSIDPALLSHLRTALRTLQENGELARLRHTYGLDG